MSMPTTTVRLFFPRSLVGRGGGLLRALKKSYKGKELGWDKGRRETDKRMVVMGFEGEGAQRRVIREGAKKGFEGGRAATKKEGGLKVGGVREGRFWGYKGHRQDTWEGSF